MWPGFVRIVQWGLVAYAISSILSAYLAHWRTHCTATNLRRRVQRHGVAQFRDRDPAALDYSYVILDATYCKARVNHRIVSQAVVVVVGVAADGRREVLGFDVGDTENEAFWTGSCGR